MYRVLKLNESAKLKEAEEFRYITTHGIGPGTVPENTYIRSEELKNGKTAIYLNRALTDEELKKYDIKPEWIQEAEELKEADEEEETIKDIENQEDLEDTLDSEEDQEENPVEEDNKLDTQLDELREILVDLDLNLYQIISKEDKNNVIYIIGKVAENNNDTLMLVDTKPEEINNELEPVEPLIDEVDLKEGPEDEEAEDKEETAAEQRFDFVVLPKTFDEINKLNPRYGDGLTPDHEAIVEYLMNCLVEINPEAAEELQKEEVPEELPIPEEIPGEEDLEDED